MRCNIFHTHLFNSIIFGTIIAAHAAEAMNPSMRDQTMGRFSIKYDAMDTTRISDIIGRKHIRMTNQDILRRTLKSSSIPV